MLTAEELAEGQSFTRAALIEAGIAITPDEQARIEVSDFGLSDIQVTGIQLLTYVNTARVCAKEIVMRPRQTCPEHRHVSVEGAPGKEETFRVRSGVVFLYVEGDASQPMLAVPPPEGVFSVWHQIVLTAGEQHTVSPNSRHWFQAGPEGAIVSEFSTRSTDIHDQFTDPRIVRMTVVAD
jgi:D-lyxose ketol-isomerase